MENREDVILFLDYLDREGQVGQLSMLLSDAIGLRDMLVKEIEKAKPCAIRGRFIAVLSFSILW